MWITKKNLNEMIDKRVNAKKAEIQSLYQQGVQDRREQIRDAVIEVFTKDKDVKSGFTFPHDLQKDFINKLLEMIDGINLSVYEKAAEDFIGSEQFIDGVVDRIVRKQLNGK